MKCLIKCWQDDRGALIAVEWVMVATLLVLGSLVGLAAIRGALLSEFEDFAGFIMNLRTDYKIPGQQNSQNQTKGSLQQQLNQSDLNIPTPATPLGSGPDPTE